MDHGTFGGGTILILPFCQDAFAQGTVRAGCGKQVSVCWSWPHPSLLVAFLDIRSDPLLHS